MKWKKLGLVYGPDATSPWARHSALTPTPFLRPDGSLRVYAGFRDDRGRSRIGFVDVDPADPTRVLRVSSEPALDLGDEGAFDSAGVILGDLLQVGDVIRMYYVGFQLPADAKFRAFTGVAESTDGGDTFRRVGTEPILGRSAEGTTIRAVHTVRREDGRYQAWYAIGSGWELIDDVPYPQYTIAYAESPDGLLFPAAGTPCVGTRGDEYRIGRPRVFRRNGEYAMLYTAGTLRKTYLPGYATSADGIRWIRRDEEVGIAPSATGWDSKHVSYLAPIEVHGRTIAFYNGNDMGKSGFGCALLLEG